MFDAEYQQMIQTNGLAVLNHIPDSYISEFMTKYKDIFDTSLKTVSNSANELFAGISPPIINAIMKIYPQKIVELCTKDTNIINYVDDKMEFINKYSKPLATGFTKNTSGLSKLTEDELLLTISMFNKSIETALSKTTGAGGLIRVFNKLPNKQKLLDALTEKSIQIGRAHV